MALIPPFFLDGVVAIGIDDRNGSREWVASGFLYAHRVSDTPPDGEYYTYLVTNCHVFKDLNKVYLRFNPKGSIPAREYPVNLLDNKGIRIWFPHPNSQIDVAITPINTSLLIADGIQAFFYRSDQLVANVDKLNEIGISEGDFVYVLGFPMGFVGGERNMVIARSGSIARVRDTLARTNSQYLIDAFVFPGNSGGPVILKPEAMAIQGTKSQNVAYLIGIICSSIPYTDVAISPQTGRPRITFEENSGLTKVHPIDYVQDAVKEHLKTIDQDKKTV